MAPSGINSREKTIIAILAVVIVIALIGIGILVARLVTGDKEGGETGGITPVATAPGGAVSSEATATLVANPSLKEPAEATPAAVGDQPVAVVRVESPKQLLPAILTDHALHPGHRYRLEITAIDGSSVAIRGSWSQSAKTADGNLELPLPESIEGKTPFRLDIEPPAANPTSWSLSASASPKDLLGNPPKLVIIVWDVTGSK
ncbi:MAG: hypothetical protein PVH17_07630 [Anaerolineae bacterium]|jgi:flagellar basal body-associated protein FliL